MGGGIVRFKDQACVCLWSGERGYGIELDGYRHQESAVYKRFHKSGSVRREPEMTGSRLDVYGYRFGEDEFDFICERR